MDDNKLVITLSNMKTSKRNGDAESSGESMSKDSLNSHDVSSNLKKEEDDHSKLNKTEEELEREAIARKESEAVDRARLMCFMVYLTSALSVSIAVFVIALNNEQSTFVFEVS